MKKTLVIGASENPGRYSNMAIRQLRAHGHPVVAIGKKSGQVLDVHIDTDKLPFEQIDTVTLYLNPFHQSAYYNYILSLHPVRIIFNPGTENADFYKLAQNYGIEVDVACTLVLLSTGQY